MNRRLPVSPAAQRLPFLLLVLFIVTGIGTAGFMAIEKLSFIEALYFNIVTMATVGYGDIHPTGQPGRLLALFIIIMGGGTFLAVIANVTGVFLQKREEEQRLRKVNMVLGVFYSEIGYYLMTVCAAADHHIETIRPALVIGREWGPKQFQEAIRSVERRKFMIDIHRIDLTSLAGFLLNQRKELLALLENPVLIEHDDFSEALLGVFHLADELRNRPSFKGLPESDLAHLAHDINRAYGMIALQWLSYLQHLKSQYPFLYSLALRQNPFNPNASVVVLNNEKP